jgi:hypothetical protein
MCNDYGIDIPFRLFVEAFSDLRIRSTSPAPAPAGGLFEDLAIAYRPILNYSDISVT